MELYTYDHCPYCVKARMVFGIKNVPFENVILQNDDEKTPVSMIGVKQVPILKTNNGRFLPESMDIVNYVDNRFGRKEIDDNLKNEELNVWLEETKDYLYRLCMPRWIKADFEEFRTFGAKHYFTKKKEHMIGSFEANLADSAIYIEKANKHLEKLEIILKKANEAKPKPNLYVNTGLSNDDFHLFAVLRSLSIVAGLNYPETVNNYRRDMSALSNVNLNDDIAI